MRKVQTQLLVSPSTRERADRLALILGQQRAEILRNALEGHGLPGLEVTHAEKIKRLDTVAEKLQVPWETVVSQAMAEGIKDLVTLEGMDRWPGLRSRLREEAKAKRARVS